MKKLTKFYLYLEGEFLNKIAIVVLNYENYWDTIECLISLLEQKECNIEIIVIDNGSKNESIDYLKEFSDYPNITIISSPENLGFSQGNNIGIHYAIETLKIKKVFVLNNDTIINDEFFFEKLNQIQYSRNIGAIGVKIYGSDNLNQNPIYKEMTYGKLGKDFIAMRFNKFFMKVKRKKEMRSSNYDASIKSEETLVGNYFMLHGSAIFLTENYLERIPGLYNRTFLYYEESILALLLKKNKLSFLYHDAISLYHKEDKSSEISFQNKSTVKLNYLLSSIRKSFPIIYKSPRSIKKEVFLTSKKALSKAEVWK